MKAKAHVPGLAQHRLVLHHLAGCHQDPHDNALLAAIDGVMRLVPEVRATAFEAQGRGIGVGGADAKVGGALIHPMHLALWPARCRDPVVARGIGLGE